MARDNHYDQDSIDREIGEERRSRNYDDLQNELAGRDTGRQRRFLGGDATSAEATERKKREERAWQSALQRMMQDPVYAARYRDTMDALNRAERATDAALRIAERNEQDKRERLDDMLRKANRLPDGRAVFRDAQGKVRTADGRIVSDDEASAIQWHDGAPGYETYRDANREVKQARRQTDELRHYRVDVLGASRNRMEDEDDPPSKAELEQIKKDIEDKAPAVVRQSVASPDLSAPPPVTSPPKADIPTL